MIQIGIVDNETRDQLKQALARFGAENGTELNVQEFDCAAVYLAAQDRDFDILYLDIDMPQMSGMELAEKIRETDSRRYPHFLHKVEQFALNNGYSVGALGFIVKPIQWYSFHMYLTRALKVRTEKRAGQKTAPPHIVVKDGTSGRRLSMQRKSPMWRCASTTCCTTCAAGDGKPRSSKTAVRCRKSRRS